MRLRKRLLVHGWRAISLRVVDVPHNGDLIRRIVAVALLCVVTLSPWRIGSFQSGAVTISAAGETLSILQWNTYHGGYGTDNVLDRDRQVAWMLSRAVDIISLNEVTATDAAIFKTKVEAATGVTWYSHHIAAQADGTGNQILSRYPFLSTSNYRMRTNGTYTRGVAQATLDVVGRAVNIFSTHLDNDDDAIRSAQVKELLAFMSGFAEPRIVAGDLNAAPGTGSILTLTADYVDTWAEAVSSSAATAYPPDNPADAGTRTQQSRIDYVLYSEMDAELEAASGTVPDTRDLANTDVKKLLGTSDDKGVRPSDHNPLWLTLRFRSSPDVTPPYVSILEPNNGATVSGTVRVVTPAADDRRVNAVDLKVDGTVVATDSLAPFEFAWNSGTVSVGTHTLVALARDPSGNTAESSAVAVNVQQTGVVYGDVVLFAGDAPVLNGTWTEFADTTAAGGVRVVQPDVGAAKISTALASPTHYFDMTFSAEAGRAYRLWLRGKAELNSYNNDSVHVQFSDSLGATGTPVYRIGTTSSAPVVLEDCSGCGLSGWGWQDNGYGAGVLGPLVYFATTGTHTVRIQAREDGLGIDQIVLSLGSYLVSAPGTLKNDTTILPRSIGATSSNTPPAVTLTNPAAGTTLTAPATFIMTAAATDADGTIQQVDFYAETTRIGSATSSPYTITWTTSTAGTYTLTAVATDNAGASTTSASVTIQVTPPANTPPAVTLTSPAAGTTLTAPATFTLTAMASDADGTIQQVDFYAGTTQIGSATSSPYTIAWTTSTAGTYTLTAVATDNAGASTTSADVQVLVATSGISLTATGMKVKGVQRVDLAWTGATSTHVEVFRGGVSIAVTANDGAYTDNLNRKGSGTYQYRVCEAGTNACSPVVTVAF